jgi:hypothetical protein
MLIEDCFEAAREVSGYPAWQRLDQSNEIMKMVQDQTVLKDDDRAGLCGGVSLMYLASMRMSQCSLLFRGGVNNNNGNVGVDNEARGVWAYVKSCQKLLHFADMKDCKFEWAGKLTGLQYIADYPQACPVSELLSDSISKKGGYYLIGTPNHYCAAANLQMVYKFFDPNAGEVSFGMGDLTNFKKFVLSYLNHSSVKKLYDLKLGNKIYVIYYVSGNDATSKDKMGYSKA